MRTIELHPHLEPEQSHSYTDIVVIRPPKLASLSDMNTLASKLHNQKFLPIFLPFAQPNSSGFTPDRFFPTNVFRCLGNLIICNEESALNAIFQTTQAVTPTLEDQFTKDKILTVTLPFRGGDYLHHDDSEIFIYNHDGIFDKGKIGGFPEQNTHTLEKLKRMGWTVIDVSDVSEIGCDLDLLMSSPFHGKDGNLHVITIQEFQSKVQEINNKAPVPLIPHPIPYKEAIINSGCNIADLRGGRVLITPHPENAPTAHQLIHSLIHPSITLLTAFPGFVDRLSGPRCAISSIPIQT